jgi:cytochrome c5
MTRSSPSRCRRISSGAAFFHIAAALIAIILTAGLTAAVQTPAQPARPAQPAPLAPNGDDQTPFQPAPPGDDHPLFPIGPGRELVFRVCSKCHEPEKAADQQFDKAGWKRLVDDMAEQGATATDEEFDQIVCYLSKAFPASK